MITLLTILHVVVCIFLIGIVLLQHGKGADIGATFGGSGQTVFGTDGPLPLLNKITTAAAIIFMMTSVALAYNSAHKTRGSVMESVATPAPMAPQALVVPPPADEMPLTRSPATPETTPASAEFPAATQGQDVKVEAPAVAPETDNMPEEAAMPAETDEPVQQE